MKISLFIIFMTLGTVTLSQVSFFTSICRNYKISFNEVQYNGSKTSENLTFPDFKIYQSSRTFDQPKRASISLGVSYKKHRVYLALQNDGVSSKYSVYVQAYDFFSNSYHGDAFRGTGRSVQSRFSLNHDFQIINKEKKTNLFISSSLGLCYRPGPKGIGPVGALGSGGNLEPNKIIEVNSKSFTDVAKYVVNFGGGIGTDLYFRRHYFCTFSIDFTYSNKNLYYTENTVTVWDNSSTKEYKFKTLDKCAGIYFGVSRKFQIFPWKSIKNNLIWEEFHPLNTDK